MINCLFEDGVFRKFYIESRFELDFSLPSTKGLEVPLEHRIRRAVIRHVRLGARLDPRANSLTASTPRIHPEM